MEYQRLGKTELRVSALGVGTWQLCGPGFLAGRADGYPDPGADAAVDLVRRCGDLGINLIDTAPMYGLGEGERRVGLALRGRRDQWVVSTKFGLQQESDGGRRVNLVSIREQLEGSLARLGTDYVDLFLYHCPPDPSRIEDVLGELEKLKQAGKLRYHGISTLDSGAIRQLVEANAIDVVMLAQSMVTHPEESLGLVRKHDLGTLVRGVLEWGRLSGDYFDRASDRARKGSPEVRFANDDIRREAFRDDDLSRYACFRELVPHGATMATFAMRYVLDFATTHSVVLGGKTIEQYREALGALELPSLDPRTLEHVTRLRSRLKGRGPWRRAYRAARSLLRADRFPRPGGQ